MEITIYSALIWLTSTFIFSLSLVVYLGSNRLSSRAFAVSVIWVALWTIATGLIVSAPDKQSVEIYDKISYFLSSTVAASFFYFFLPIKI